MTDSRPLRAALLGVIALAALLPATPGRAATLTVNPFLPGAFPTIQSAVDAAAPGDTIIIRSKGTPYTEDVRITGKRDLVVQADRGVTIQTGGGPPADGIVRVESTRRVMLKGLLLFCDDRDSRRGFVFTNVVDVTLSASTADVCATGVAVIPPATHTVISASAFTEDAIGVDVQGGQDTLILGSNTVRCDTGVRSTGDGTRIMGHRAEDSGADGVACVGGSNLIVDGGGFFGNSVAAVNLRGACRSATVQRTALGCKPISQPPKLPNPPLPNGFSGVTVQNSGVYTITNNTISGCSGTGILLMPDPQSLASPGGGYVAFNTVSGCSGNGFQVDAAFDGWVLEGNLAQSNKGAGFKVNSSRNVFVRNIALTNTGGGFAMGDDQQVNGRDAINPADNVGIDNVNDSGPLPLDLQ